MNAPALIAGLFGCAVTIRGLMNGSGSPDGQGFRRDEQPAIYWGIILAGALITGSLFYVAFATSL